MQIKTYTDNYTNFVVIVHKFNFIGTCTSLLDLLTELATKIGVADSVAVMSATFDSEPSAVDAECRVLAIAFASIAGDSGSTTGSCTTDCFCC